MKIKPKVDTAACLLDREECGSGGARGEVCEDV